MFERVTLAQSFKSSAESLGVTPALNIAARSTQNNNEWNLE